MSATSNSRGNETSFPSAQPLWVENLSLILGRIFALTSLILVIIWATGNKTDEKFLGGLDMEENVFNWHPVLMISALCCTAWSVTAFRNKTFTYTTSRYLHVFFHLGAKLCLTLGIRAVWQSKDDTYGDKNPHVYTLHAWLGLTTTILLFQNDIIGGITFLLPYVSVAIRKIYTPYHIFFGKIALVMAVVTIETGIMEKNVYLGCIPDLEGEKDTSPGSHYQEIPKGCRVSNGLGLTVALGMLFLLFALRNKKLKMPKPSGQSGADQKRSFVGTLLSPLYRTEVVEEGRGSGEQREGGEQVRGNRTPHSAPRLSMTTEDFRARASSVT